MKALAILGSRNPDGQTARATLAVVNAMEQGGAVVEQVFLPASNIRCCQQCDNDGWGTCLREGECCLDDGFSEIVANLKAADIVVFATPVYYADLSESLRAFLDRLRRTCTHADGSEGITGKRAVGVCVAGGGGGGAPECCANLQRILGICGFDVVDMVPVRRQDLEEKFFSLDATGKALVESN